MTSHAIQLDGERFRILVTQPTQLTWSCNEGSKVDSIQGVTIIKLSKRCPKANTPDHIFIRNPTIATKREVVTLPALQNNTEWFENIRDEFRNYDLKAELQAIHQTNPGPVPLVTFRKELESKNTRMIELYFGYVQYVTTSIVVLICLRYLIGWMRFLPIRRLLNIRRRGKQESPSALQFELTKPKGNGNDLNQESMRKLIIKNYSTSPTASYTYRDPIV